eukprot:gene7448-7658_t
MGACHDHWKKFIAELGTQYTAYAFDLLGFGDSDKPAHPPHKHLYDYDTWSQQTQDFINQVVQAPAVLVGNSAGALTALQVAVAAPNLCRGLLLLNCTMRRNHERNQHPLLHPLITGWQWLLQETPVGAALVSWVLDQPGRLESILKSAYGDASCLSPELLASFRQHLSSSSSCAVLLDVFSNSTGPLPQDLLPFVTVPMLVVWGAADPWEPVAKAEELFSGWAADDTEVLPSSSFDLTEKGSSVSLKRVQMDMDMPFWAGAWSSGTHTEQNQRLHMEDKVVNIDLTAHPAFSGHRRAAFAAVFDGHGGDEAAEYLQDHLFSHLLEQQDLLASEPLKAFGAAVHLAEQEVLMQFEATSCKAGSTLLAALLVDDKLFVANVGDSRAVIGRGTQAQQLTRDHKPTCLQEQERIKRDHPEAEISGDGYLYGELGVARALGSQHLKRDPSKRALVASADLFTVQLQKEDDFVVLATDGLWDKVGSSEAVQVMRRTLASSRDASTAAGALVDRAQRLGSQDNISVVTLLLHDRPFQLPQRNSMLFKRQQATAPLAVAESNAETPNPDQQPLQAVAVPISAAPPPSALWHVAHCASDPQEEEVVVEVVLKEQEGKKTENKGIDQEPAGGQELLAVKAAGKGKSKLWMLFKGAVKVAAAAGVCLLVKRGARASRRAG